MNRGIKKFIGTKQFYTYVLGIVIPMILQNLITNFVSMLDNIMVGQVGTEQMSGVSIVNQFMFVFNITIFGAVSGASIFGTQYFGKGDAEGQRYTVRFRLILSVILICIGAVVFHFFGSNLIDLFLSKDDSPEVIEATLQYGLEYLEIMTWSLIPFAIGQAYASVVRECGETKIPMIGSIAAIGVNLVLDYGLIFGKLGMPQMGVKGAAIATLMAKCIEALVVILWAHSNPKKNPYVIGLLKSPYIPGKLAKEIAIKGCPLLFNEFLWAFGMSMIAQCYSVRGIDVVAARNISSTMTNLFNVVFVQMGGATGIIVGMKLGAGDHETAKDYATKMTAFSIFGSSLMSLFMVPLAFWFPHIYNTSSEIQALATFFIIISAIAMPIWSYTNSSYFILRSGGKTGITFLFDFVFTWVVMIPLAFCLTHFTSMDIHVLFAVVTFSELLKVIVGYLMVRSGIWINTIVDEI